MVNWQSNEEIAKDGGKCAPFELTSPCAHLAPAESFDRLMHTLLGLYM